MAIDSHVHFTDLRVSSAQQKVWLESARAAGILQFLEAGVDPEGWLRQIEFKKKYPECFKIALGLHPYFVAQKNEQECEEAMDLLAQFMHEACAVGETGLDFREEYIENNAEDRQIIFFENQIQLAIAVRKPLVLHIVRAHNEAQKILNLWDAHLVGGMVHAFNASVEIAEQYLKLNMLVSVGGAVVNPQNKKLQEAVRWLPIDKILLESDSPDQKPYNWPEAQNSPLSVLKVAEAVAQLKDMTVSQVLEKTTQNFKMLFS